MPREILSVRDVCERYHLSEKTVRRKIKAGLLDARRCGRLLRLDADEVEAALMRPSTSGADDIESVIARIVSAAPPLTDDQRNRISRLLRTGSGAA